MTTVTEKSAPCTCIPEWLRAILPTRTVVDKSQVIFCCICKHQFEPGVDVICRSYCFSDCHNVIKRTHVYNVIACKACWPVVEEIALSDRGKQYLWLGTAEADKVINENKVDIVKALVARFYGNVTGRYCHNKTCNTAEHQNTPRFKLCGACKKASYCSEACQREDWKMRHKVFCKLNQGQEVSKEEMDSVQGEITKLKDGSKRAQPANEKEEQPCPCFGEVEMHQFNAFKNDYCSNLGCFNKTHGPIQLRMCTFSCSKKLVPIHIIPEVYCSEKCIRKAYKK